MFNYHKDHQRQNQSGTDSRDDQLGAVLPWPLQAWCSGGVVGGGVIGFLPVGAMEWLLFLLATNTSSRRHRLACVFHEVYRILSLYNVLAITQI